MLCFVCLTALLDLHAAHRVWSLVAHVIYIFSSLLEMYKYPALISDRAVDLQADLVSTCHYGDYGEHVCMTVGVANSSLRGSAPAPHPQQPTTAAAAVPSSGLSSRSAATNITAASTSLVNSSLTDAVTQQLVGSNIQLTKQPVLGPAAGQRQHRSAETHSRSAGMHVADESNVASSQRGQSGGGLASADARVVPDQATDRSSDCASEATAATEALLADTHRSTDFGRLGCIHTQQMSNTAARAAFRPASPPFLFEAAEEDSLVDFSGKADPPDAAQPRRVDLVARDVVQARLAAGNQAGACSQGSDAVPSARLHPQQPALSQTCAAPSSARPQALIGASQSSWQTHRMLPSATAAAEPVASLQQPSESDFQRPESQGIQHVAAGRHVSEAQPMTRLTEAAGPGDEDLHSETGNGAVVGSKENEPGGMARAVRGPREGQGRAGRQTAARPPKPITSSKVSHPVLLTFLSSCFTL